MHVITGLGAADVPVSSPAYGVGFSNAIAEAMATGYRSSRRMLGMRAELCRPVTRIRWRPRWRILWSYRIAHRLAWRRAVGWWIYLRWNAPLKRSIFCIGWDRMPRRYRPQRKAHEGFIKRAKFMGNSPLTWGAACV